MKIYKYYCNECGCKEIINSEYGYPDLCPQCYSDILLYTDIKSIGDKYRVLISKKASDVQEGDLLFDRYSNKSYMVKGVRCTTKKWQPAISFGLENFGSKTYLEDEIVYCVTGLWDGEED